jgi:MFS family permease
MRRGGLDQEQNGLWTIDFVLNLLTAHFMFASYTALLTVVPLYVLDRGGETWHVGVVVGSFGVIGLVIRPFGGRWVYTLGARRVAIVGTAIIGVSALLHIFAFNVWLIVPVRMMQGVGLALAPVATSTIVANLAPVRQRARAMSYMGNSIAVAGLYSPVLAFWLFSRFGFEASFIYAGAVALLATAIALRLSETATRIPVPQGTGGKVPLVSTGALFPTIVFMCYTLTTAPVNAFLPILADERGLGNPGLYFTVVAFVTIISMATAGPAADRLGRAAVIVPGLLLAGAAMFLLAGAENRAMFLGAAFLSGAGFGLIQPGIQSLTVDRVPTRERSSALATLQQAWDVGGSGGAFAMSPIAGALGVAPAFVITGVVAALGALGFVEGNRRETSAQSGKSHQRTDP